MNETPSFTIPATRVDEFRRQPRAPNLRVGQAFHQTMQLEKMTQDREFCDTLYQADGLRAWKMINSITDPNN